MSVKSIETTHSHTHTHRQEDLSTRFIYRISVFSLSDEITYLWHHQETADEYADEDIDPENPAKKYKIRCDARTKVAFLKNKKQNLLQCIHSNIIVILNENEFLSNDP